MKKFFEKFMKVKHSIIVDNANLASTATAIYDVCGHRADTATFEQHWTIGGREWLITFKATGAQWSEIQKKLSRR